nr:BrnT family toxin [Paraburkholderia solisilvae]
MHVTCDPLKNESNLAKHGVDLSSAAYLDWSEVMAHVDTRRDYREVREIGFGVIDERLFCVVFTQRGDTMHIISLRKANHREVRDYVEQTQNRHADSG